MTYYVIDPENIPAQQTRMEAENLKSDLTRDNPEKQWQVVVQAVFNEENAMEKLYTLAANLLQMTGANPLTFGLELQKLDGTSEFLSALSIMNQARKWIDATEQMQ